MWRRVRGGGKRQNIVYLEKIKVDDRVLSYLGQ